MEQGSQANQLTLILRQTNLSDESKAAKYVTELRRANVDLGPVLMDHENYPTISSLKNEYGFNIVFKIITALILDFVNSINVTQPSEGQIYEMAKELIADNPTYKPEDFKLFFTDAKKGKYGEMYNRFDMSVLYSWLKVYNEERTFQFEAELEKRKSEFNLDRGLRTNDIKKIHDLYDQTFTQTMNERQQKEYDTQRKRAIAQWKLDFDLYFTGKEITEDLYNDYTSKNPLDEDYIAKFILATYE